MTKFETILQIIKIVIAIIAIIFFAKLLLEIKILVELIARSL